MIIILAVDWQSFFDNLWSWVENVNGSRICVLGILLILIFAYERGLKDKTWRKELRNIVGEALTPLISDQPTANDTLGREKYVEMLGRKIISTFIANRNRKDVPSFAINIEENYGYGKTSFLMRLHKWFYYNHNEQAIWIDFRPWLCDNARSLVFEFFNQLANEVSIDIHLREDLIEYGNALANQAMQMAFGIPGFQFHPSANSLKSQHDKIKDGLQKDCQLFIITIDDLDRLDKEEVNAVLKLIRDTADFPNIFYIVATERDYLCNVLRDSGVEDPDRYIEKFFNLTFYLPAHENNFKKDFLSLTESFYGRLCKSKEKKNEFLNIQNEPILNSCFNDIRDVKRFVNQLITYIEILGNNEYNLYDATMLTLLQYKCPELYKMLRDRDDLLLIAQAGNGTDSILTLKDNPVQDGKTRDFMLLLPKKENRGNETDEKVKKEPIKHLHERHNKKIYRNEKLGEEILDVLFGGNTANNENAIKRSNRFFLYMSGHEHSKSITKAEMIAIMNLPLEKYKASVDELFETEKSDSFENEIGFFTRQGGIDVLDTVRKIFYLMSKQYDYTEEDKRFSRSWYALNSQSHELFSVLYDMMGDTTPVQYRHYEKFVVDLMPLIKTEQLEYVVSLVKILDRDIADFNYTRDQIDVYASCIIDRFINERLESKGFINKNDLEIATFFREDFYTYREVWQQKFSKYLCSDESITRFWLSHLIILYKSNGNIEWQYDIKRILFGSPIDHWGQSLMEKLQNGFPELGSYLRSLESILDYKDLVKLSDSLRDNPFIKRFVEMK